MSSWQKVQAEYPGLNNGVYLDSATHGLPATRTIQAVKERFLQVMHLARRANGTEDTILVQKSFKEARQQLARLLQVDPQEIALVDNATQGLQSLALALGLNRGDEVLFCDLDFFGLVAPWKGKGVTLKFFPARQGYFTVETIEPYLQKKTRVLVLSATQEITGFKADLKAIATLCKEKNINLVIDASHLAGNQPFHPRELGLEFVVGTGFKWLTSPFGLGFLFIAQNRLDSLNIIAPGYFNYQEPTDGWAEYLANPNKTADFDLPILSSAARYDMGGTGNYGGAFALAVAVENLNHMGIEVIGQRINYLNNMLRNSLQEVSLDPYTFPREHSSAFTVAAYPEYKKTRALYEYLTEKRIKVSLRYNAGAGGLRIAPHFYNNEEEIEALVAAIQEFAG